MSNWEEEVKKGALPPPPRKPNTSYSVVVTYSDNVKEYSRVKNINMNPGMMTLQWSDREVIIPLTTAIREIEITEEAILS